MKDTFVDIWFSQLGMDQYKIYVLLILCASTLKIYDNILDWQLHVPHIWKEFLKMTIVILATVTYLTDLNAIYGSFFLHAFYFFSSNHGIDNDYFKVGFFFITVLTILDFWYHQISFITLLEMILIGIIGYVESLWFREEFSNAKMITRLVTLLVLCGIIWLHFTKRMNLFSDITIKLMVSGIAYLGTDMFMINTLSYPKKLAK